VHHFIGKVTLPLPTPPQLRKSNNLIVFNFFLLHLWTQMEMDYDLEKIKMDQEGITQIATIVIPVTLSVIATIVVGGRRSGPGELTSGTRKCPTRRFGSREGKRTNLLMTIGEGEGQNPQESSCKR
jgi:hypothetical protein